MQLPEHIWTCQYIRLEVGDSPPKVLAETILPSDVVTRALLRKMLEDAESDKRFQLGRLPRPEAVRAVGTSGETMRYTAFDLAADRKAERSNA